MCLAVPMKIVELAADGGAVGELDGARHEVDVSLIDGPACGDYVIVHAGYAIERLDPAEAEARLRLFQSMADSAPASGPGGAA